MSLSNIIKAVTVRIALLFLNILAVWRVTVVWQIDQFWLLLLANVPFIIETFYVVIKKQGIEWKWLCPCFLFFLMSTLPAIWLLEIRRHGKYAETNITALNDVDIAGVRIPVRLDADTWVLVIEECLLYFMILGRWFLPRGEVSREQLSQLLFSFIAIASDIMELFSLFDEDVVRSSLTMTYVLLGIWSWSILQFALVLTVYNRPKRARVVEKTYSVLLEQKEAVRLEIVAIFVSLLMQDGPFLCLRLYCLLQFQLLTYSVMFFTLKNLLVILLLVYRLSILCSNNYCVRKDRGEKLRLKDFEERELAHGKIPKDRTIVVDNKGYVGERANGGVVRQRQTTSGEVKGHDRAAVTVSVIGETDVDKARVSQQSSFTEAPSFNTELTEIENFPEPDLDKLQRTPSFETSRL